MKALRIHGPSDIRLEEVITPTIEDNEVLIRVCSTGVCSTDIELFDGSMPYIKQGLTELPLIPGHEWSGRIEKAGGAVRHLPEGSLVVGDVSIGCGECLRCLRGAYHLCDYRSEVGIIKKQGAFAEYIKMPSKNIYTVPEGISAGEAAMVEPAATAVNAVNQTGIVLGDRVIVFGDGAIGLLSAQAAKCAGGSDVIVVARKEDNRLLVEEMGMHFINVKEQGLRQSIDRLIGGFAEVVIEATGNADVLDDAISLTQPGGRICGLSITGKARIPIDVDYIVTRDIKFVGVLASPGAFVPTLRLMKLGRMNARPMISKIFSLEDGPEAFKYIKDRKGPKIKILVSQGE